MGSSLAYACLKWKIRAASAQTASEHLICPPAPPQCSWGCHCYPQRGGGRGWARPTRPWGTPAESLPCTDPPSHLAWPPRHCPCASLHIVVSFGVLIIGDICLKRSSMFFQSCSVPAAHFGYEITALSPWDLCHVAVDGEWIVLTDYAVQRPFCQARFVKLSVPVPKSTKAI